jgi:hypothetical protein
MKSLQISGQQTYNRWISWLWIAVGLLLVGLHVAIIVQFQRLAVSGSGRTAIYFFLAAACGLYLIIVGIARSYYMSKFHLAGIIFVGVLLRLIMMLPILSESTDCYRYLWDGAVTAHGINPYLYSPESIGETRNENDNSTLSYLRQLSEKAGKTFSGINNPWLRTIYPPAAQGLFALAYWLTPFEMTGWRLILLAFDIIAIIVLSSLLRNLKLPLAFLVIYLWNPLLLYETHCRGHLDLIVGVLVLLFALSLIHQKPVTAGTMLAVAVGTKLWPLLLVPFLIYSFRRNRTDMLKAAAVFVVLTLLIMIPFFATLKHPSDSGTLVYTREWEVNAGIYLAFDWLGWKLSNVFGNGFDGRIFARAIIGLLVFMVSIWQARKTTNDAGQLSRSICLVFILLLLLSPTVHSWYYVVIIPLAALEFRWAFLIWTPLLPMTYFPNEIINHNFVLVLMFVPTFLLWLREYVRNKNLLIERSC